MVFVQRPQTPIRLTKNSVNVAGETISPSCEIKYLGHIISADLSDKADIMRTGLNLIRTGYQIAQAMEGCSFESKLRVFVSKAVHLYGCCTWKFTGESLTILEVARRKVLKSSSRLPIRTHTSILHSLTKFDL